MTLLFVGFFTFRLTEIGYSGIITIMMIRKGTEMLENDVALSEFLDLLADLSLNGESFEICLAALKLQSALKEVYQPY